MLETSFAKPKGHVSTAFKGFYSSFFFLNINLNTRMSSAGSANITSNTGEIAINPVTIAAISPSTKNKEIITNNVTILNPSFS